MDDAASLAIELRKRLNRPLAIGKRRIQKRIVLAPMTQLGHIALRELITQYGGYGLLFSEMCSAKTLPRENRHTSPYFRWRDGERERLVFQIFGSDPQVMADAARRIEAEGLFGVDLNFGCCVADICKQNSGAALLKDYDLCVRIVAAVRKAVECPLFVKYRVGWQDDPAPAVALAKGFETAGADALTFHPRIAPDRRSRQPKWDYIRLVKEAVSIPVFGNGNVFTRSDCLAIMQKTGCEGVAVGRMAIARPWLFAQWSDGFDPGSDIFLESARRLTALIEDHFDPPKALRRLKKFCLYFSANFRFGHSLYSSVANAKEISAVKESIEAFLASGPAVTQRPNLNLFL
jgi:nifR3 family TIM-barrel protein